MLNIETRKNTQFNLTELVIPENLCDQTKDTRFTIIFPDNMVGAIPLNPQGQRKTLKGKDYQTSRYVQVWVRKSQPPQ